MATAPDVTRESIDLDAIQKPDVINRTAPPGGKPFLPFEISDNRTVPYFLPIGEAVTVRQTSSTHGPNGYITTDSDEIEANQNRLMDKLHLAVDRFSFFDAAMENSDTLLLTYGVTARAARVAANRLKRAGKPVSLLVLKTLWPVPVNLIQQKAEKARRVVVVEMNLGQYVNEVKRVLAGKRVDFYGQMDGRLIRPQQIMEVVADDQPAE